VAVADAERGAVARRADAATEARGGKGPVLERRYVEGRLGSRLHFNRLSSRLHSSSDGDNGPSSSMVISDMVISRFVYLLRGAAPYQRLGEPDESDIEAASNKRPGSSERSRAHQPVGGLTQKSSSYLGGRFHVKELASRVSPLFVFCERTQWCPVPTRVRFT
jgi:hypothetical protein